MADGLYAAKQMRAWLGDCSEMHLWRLVHVYKTLNPPLKDNGRNYWTAADRAAYLARLEAERAARLEKQAEAA